MNSDSRSPSLERRQFRALAGGLVAATALSASTDAPRRWISRHTSKPLMSGKPTSRITSATVCAVRAASASRPVVFQSGAKPSVCNA